MPPLRIGVNALYLIPGGVGGTEIYLRGLLAGLAVGEDHVAIHRVDLGQPRQQAAQIDLGAAHAAGK